MLSRQVFRAARAAAPQRAVTLRAAPVRSFAAAATADSQPPIAVFGLDGTYASALVCDMPPSLMEHGQLVSVGLASSPIDSPAPDDPNRQV